ncbi:hypothetical protein CBS63078_2916 [Aspergillus niger]|nr:hypothetical protein CBS115989_3897 [Aspergillus niger]KAI2833749.1 hypothetical protein CBS133816_90 [Aspergillus niger]KAI2837727.1 hypothetical protein CBS11350_8571 [Aspergillus niger]KAI2855838.1 hypothetical protein CBS12448_7162 [Aspergillus niger]KAI2862607.1 hypothetical protein CBS11232_90 [Aspergillus niger]
MKIKGATSHMGSGHAARLSQPQIPQRICFSRRFLCFGRLAPLVLAASTVATRFILDILGAAPGHSSFTTSLLSSPPSCCSLLLCLVLLLPYLPSARVDNFPVLSS